ncbi:acyl-CoA reductase [Robertkochia marina]|uniref:Acyl-CoA reductase n=1 Tax=Robertkochia marina TaxID=1227945 RepID=A0A4S3M1E3_9FLAO|nr:acyl-CoA reductase [Robertkochia marina]THD67857.1 acyl-CoA reductase [Robertkochia marina]TRZ42104.1 acyl-CoA reductase [Robertkochia marina]
MDIHRRIEALDHLGRFLKQFSQPEPSMLDDIPHNELFFEGFKHQIKLAGEHNPWFNPSQLAFTFEGWSDLLTTSKLKKWMAAYLLENQSPKTIGLVMAGNIPMVGFHDLLSVLILGHKASVKMSSNDKHLIPYLIKYLETVEPSFKNKVNFDTQNLKNYDAVIATGSDNTARYFEYYFKGKPHIIRKNRNSVAVLTGQESKEELQALGEDIFRYYGLGCRSVSKLFVPVGYDFDQFFQGIYPFRDIIDEIRYANNYDYNKAVYLMSLFKIRENGFLMLKEDEGYASPIATLFYEHYSDADTLQKKLEADKEKIQCIVGNTLEEAIPFGMSQRPGLKDYADGVDVIRFLLSLA